MLKFTIALLFAQVLVAAPLPSDLVKRKIDCSPPAAGPIGLAVLAVTKVGCSAGAAAQAAGEAGADYPVPTVTGD